jgi:cytochrome c oxidase subunit 4
MADHVSPISLYITIFASLMVLTGVTVGAAYVDLGAFNFATAMVIASFKASLVVWFFMHVKYQSHLTKLTVATGLFFLTILLGMSLVDYVSRDNFQGPGGLPASVNPDAEIHVPTPAQPH